MHTVQHVNIYFAQNIVLFALTLSLSISLSFVLSISPCLSQRMSLCLSLFQSFLSSSHNFSRLSLFVRLP